MTKSSNSIYARLYVELSPVMNYVDFRKVCTMLEAIADVVIAQEFKFPPVRKQSPGFKKFGYDPLATNPGVPDLIEALAAILVVDKMKAQHAFMELKKYRVVAAFRNDSTGS